MPASPLSTMHNGNMTKKTDAGQVTSYIYNVEDRLTEVWNGAVGSGSLISTLLL